MIRTRVVGILTGDYELNVLENDELMIDCELKRNFEIVFQIKTKGEWTGEQVDSKGLVKKKRRYGRSLL